MKNFRLVSIGIALLGLSAISACRVESSSETSGSHLLRGEDSPSRESGSDSRGRLQSNTAATAAPALCPSGLKVVGGKTVESSELLAGALVKIWIKNQRFCSGTLIGPQQVVTAAHCFKDISSAEDLRLGFGVEGLAQDDIKVKSFLVHPSFKGVASETQSFKNQALHDVAVITFEGTPAETLRPVTIAASESIYPGIPALLAGYGAHGSTDKVRRPLTQVSLEIASQRLDLNELQLKTGESKGACFGDSGGPTFILGDKGQCLLLVGSTTGPGRNTDFTCESGGGTLMDLTRYKNWIHCAFAQMEQPLSESTPEEIEACRSEGT